MPGELLPKPGKPRSWQFSEKLAQIPCFQLWRGLNLVSQCFAHALHLMLFCPSLPAAWQPTGADRHATALAQGMPFALKDLQQSFPSLALPLPVPLTHLDGSQSWIAAETDWAAGRHEEEAHIATYAQGDEPRGAQQA